MASLPQNNLLEQLAKHSSTAQSKLSLSKPKPGGFSFKKKSATGTPEVEIPNKVTGTNVLANRNVNVHIHNLVTKSPLTLSNMPEKSQKSKINNFFSVSSKSASCTPPRQQPPAVSGKTDPTVCIKSDDSFRAGIGSSSTSLDISLGFPIDNWDDIDDFEPPSKTRNSPEASGNKKRTTESPSTEEKTGSFVIEPDLRKGLSSKGTSSDVYIKAKKSDPSVKAAAVSPVLSVTEDLFDYKVVSPVKNTKWRSPAQRQRKPVVSESEEDSNVVLEHFKAKSDNKQKMTMPIEVIDNLEPEDDFDYIPPSPTPDEISPVVTNDTRSKSAGTESRAKPVQSKKPAAADATDNRSKDKNDELYSIMESICALVDTIPEHELIALTSGNELLLKRALRKRIIATGCGSFAFVKAQQPDSTVRSESSFKDKSQMRCDTPSCSSTPAETKKSAHVRRSSVIYVDYDSDHSDSVINSNPRASYVGEESVCDSPSTYSFINQNFSKSSSIDKDDSDLFFTPKKPAAVAQSRSSENNPPAEKEDAVLDDFGDDDFDIDDLNDSDIPDYFDEPTSSWVSAQNSKSVITSIKEGGPSKSLWEKKPTTPAQAPKLAKMCYPEPTFRNPAHDRFRGFSFPHSQEMMKIFHKRFGLHQFRFNQLESINATLLGEDTFVLMPTGGGKSLCYQLPACVSAGVTVVISPLKSLIIDQVQKLTTLDIPATSLSGGKNENEAARIYMQLSRKDPIVKLLYVTPEKVSASHKLISALQNLYERGLLCRFVIDEAHCVSQWGHDFRPDYKKLHELRQKFPKVPMIALTATATPRVQKDILNQLNMTRPQVFTMSFNRTNLKYSVLPKKPKKVDEDCIDWIKKHHPRDSGIVYCLSRNDCDAMAESLQRAGILALSYHAGLGDGDREYVQTKWINQDGCQVICATIAFGMGIDKPDVRYVIHASLPKSMEGYYQESGRAGRDGEKSHCILFYSYADVHRIKRIISMDREGDRYSKATHYNNLQSMVQFCENAMDCRRIQLLAYFGELNFNRSFCKDHSDVSCDNCARPNQYKIRNVTEDVKNIVRFVQEKCEKVGQRFGKTGQQMRLTLNMLVDIFIGAKSAKIQSGMFAMGAAYSKHNADRLFKKLVLDNVLVEDLYITNNGQAVAYVSAGPKAISVLSGHMQVEFYETESVSTMRRQKAAVAKSVTKREEMVQQCLKELTDLCKQLGKAFSLHYYNIFSTSTLKKIAEKLSSDPDTLLQIDGVTEDKLEKYGAEVIQVLQKYSEWQLPAEEPTNDGWIDTTRGRTNSNLNYEDDDDPESSNYFRKGAGQGQKRKKAPFFKYSKKRKGYGGSSGTSKGRGFSSSSNKSSSSSSSRGRGSKASAGDAAGGRRPGFLSVPTPQTSARPFLKPAFSHFT